MDQKIRWKNEEDKKIDTMIAFIRVHLTQKDKFKQRN